ncbi:transposable element Tcb1 transposase [Rhizophagus clarus]|uniref:Transposable element Tcb1 transposase n=1 Tax=Rhizophagus clarus TaxID=94130 RepID=A0A8H3QEH9_9GLOM|nr:transposable element Tcb1 transposase [Rhizophagus clarus]
MTPTSELEIQRLTSTVYDIVNQLKKTGSVKHLPIPGHPLILSPTKHRYFDHLLKNDNVTTSALMTKKLNNLYLNLNASHVEARLQWALNHNHDDWSHTIFSDESMFQTFCNSQIVRYKASNLCPSHPMVKHPYKVHVWGAFSRQGLIGVALFTGKMNSAKYHEILQFQLLSNTYHASYG